MKPLHMVGLLVAGVALIVAANSLYTVTETERALVVTLGKIDKEVIEPGLYVRKPFVQQLVKFDSRILNLTGESEEVVTRDKKRILVDTFTRWRISDAASFYESVRTESNGRAQLLVIVNSAAKRALARNDMMDIISGDRMRVMHSILDEARQEAARLGIEVIDVRIKRADLPQENSVAIYNRMRAERNKEATDIRARGEEEAQKIRANAERQRTVILAEADRDAMKLRGEGDAESIRISGEAFSKSPRFYAFIRSLEAYREALGRNDAMILVDPKIKFLDNFMDGASRSQ